MVSVKILVLEIATRKIDEIFVVPSRNFKRVAKGGGGVPIKHHVEFLN